MNIYDEVLDYVKYKFQGDFKELDKTVKALERAKKVEELLKLYKHLNKLEHLDELEITAYTLYDINVLKGAIKQREKELEEMK